MSWRRLTSSSSTFLGAHADIILRNLCFCDTPNGIIDEICDKNFTRPRRSGCSLYVCLILGDSSIVMAHMLFRSTSSPPAVAEGVECIVAQSSERSNAAKEFFQRHSTPSNFKPRGNTRKVEIKNDNENEDWSEMPTVGWLTRSQRSKHIEEARQDCAALARSSIDERRQT
jgi:hypothetical protein